MPNKIHEEHWKIKKINKNEFTILRDNYIIATTKSKTKAKELIATAPKTIIFEEKEITLSYPYKT